jgi:RNA polymerase-binding protein DksA
MPEATYPVLRAQLTDERDHLIAQLTHMGRAPGTSELEFDEGFADSGQVTAERGEVDALVGSLRETLGDIDNALEKIDTGTYGICERCGKPIGEDRLAAMPMARLCIQCASARR